MKSKIFVQWIDACSQDEWTEVSDGPAASLVESVGFLVEDTEEHLIIALSFCEFTESMSQSLAIPKCCVRRVSQLI